MNDLVHTATNWLSYNRYAALAVLLAAALTIPACVGQSLKGDSPITGRPETRASLDGQETASKIEADAKLRKAIKSRDAAAAALTRELEQRAGDINAAYEQTVIDVEAKSQALAAAFEAGRRQIAEKEEAIQWWLDAANSVVNLVAPGFGQIATPILTLIGGGLALDNRRKNKVIANQRELLSDESAKKAGVA